MERDSGVRDTRSFRAFAISRQVGFHAVRQTLANGSPVERDDRRTDRGSDFRPAHVATGFSRACLVLKCHKRGFVEPREPPLNVVDLLCSHRVKNDGCARHDLLIAQACAA